LIFPSMAQIGGSRVPNTRVLDVATCIKDKPVELCTPNPCQNGGSCAEMERVDAYSCMCAAGFEGTDCSVFDDTPDSGVSGRNPWYGFIRIFKYMVYRPTPHSVLYRKYLCMTANGIAERQYHPRLGFRPPDVGGGGNPNSRGVGSLGVGDICDRGCFSFDAVQYPSVTRPGDCPSGAFCMPTGDGSCQHPHTCQTRADPDGIPGNADDVWHGEYHGAGAGLGARCAMTLYNCRGGRGDCHGPCHSDAASYLLLAVLRAQYPKRRLHDSTARGQATTARSASAASPAHRRRPAPPHATGTCATARARTWTSAPSAPPTACSGTTSGASTPRAASSARAWGMCGRGASASSRGRRSATARRLAATTARVRPARRRRRLRQATPSAGPEPTPTAAAAPSTTTRACWATRAAGAGATPTRLAALATGTRRVRTEIEKMVGLTFKPPFIFKERKVRNRPRLRLSPCPYVYVEAIQLWLGVSL
jgi:hypothetical protein